MKRLNSLEGKCLLVDESLQILMLLRAGIVKELSGHVETSDSSPTKPADSTQNGEDIHIRTVGMSHTAPSGLRVPESGDGVQIERSLGTLMLSDEGKTRYVQRNFFSRLTDEASQHRHSTKVGILTWI